MGGIYVTGSTRSANYPTTPGAFDTTHNGVSDAFVTKLGPTPVNTAPCQITTGGWIITVNKDRATFGGSAKTSESGDTQGAQSFVDHGPAQPLSLHSISVLTVMCDDSNRATIFGQATINGSDVVDYQIIVQDLGGRREDTYQLIVDNYDSGEQTLRGGNIQIRRK